ncbi:hypothetical protein [Moheibacter sediminis]|uniref:Uncharacterized protein n=1 Tax=Moheibacter sediminis TaxID=1434700 RepID=A0A1W2AV97_9FLAO|nr:hypothetical protein [Moheibacter sediminis]SMC64613.1 hypothetical protein SAMN06296427_105101 [Moheibacter sediminis]
MKNIFLILCSLLLVINCKSDDESASDNNGNANNKMSYKGNEVSLNGVEFYNVPEEGVILYIFDDDIYYDGAQVNFRDVYFEGLDGSYTFHVIDQNFDPNSHFWSGSIVNHFVEALGEPLIGGEITINISGSNITVDFELETAEGTAIGHYQGSFQERG